MVDSVVPFITCNKCPVGVSCVFGIGVISVFMACYSVDSQHKVTQGYY